MVPISVGNTLLESNSPRSPLQKSLRVARRQQFERIRDSLHLDPFEVRLLDVIMSTTPMAAFCNKVFGKALADGEFQIDHQQACFDPLWNVVMHGVWYRCC